MLELLAALDAETRLPSAQEQGVLARWSGWGSLPEVFDDDARHNEDATQARQLLQGRARAAAARTTLNAHYTDAALVKAVWSALGAAGFDESAGGRVLEPGCGAGTFIGFAPDHVRDVVGVELDPTTARVASLLYPSADIRSESFAETHLPEGRLDLVIGNVPFADVVPHDSTHNRLGLSLHNYFIYKSLHLVRPRWRGGGADLTVDDGCSQPEGPRRVRSHGRPRRRVPAAEPNPPPGGRDRRHH